MKEQIVINMPLKNGSKTLKTAINSILEQKNVKRDVLILIGNDNSTDNSDIILKTYEDNPNIKILKLDYGASYLTRNHLLEYTRNNFPNCVLIGRLDCDDFLVDEFVLATIENEFDNTDFDVLLTGNKQIRNKIILNESNKASKKLLDSVYLKSRLYQMSIGNAKAELPSCNTFIKPTIITNYPAQLSAEDHWFTVLLLLNKDSLNIRVREDLIYCVYSLDGNLTENNLNENYYYKSRKSLYQFFIKQLDDDRKTK